MGWVKEQLSHGHLGSNGCVRRRVSLDFIAIGWLGASADGPCSYFQ
jgi:hypothetical protein